MWFLRKEEEEEVYNIKKPLSQVKGNEDEEVRDGLIESIFDGSIEIIFWKNVGKTIKQEEKDELYNGLKDYLMTLHQEYSRNIEFSLDNIQYILQFFIFNIQKNIDNWRKEDIYNLFEGLNINYRDLTTAQQKISEILANYMFNIDKDIKEFFLIIQQYHIYFEHFPNDIIKNEEALPLNLYDIGIKNLDEGGNFLWFIDKTNSQRLLKIFFIRHCIIAFFESEKDDFSLIWKILLISLKKELKILKTNWSLSNTENKIIKYIIWKDIWNKLLAEYKNSFFHDTRENNLDIKKRKNILLICFTSSNYFLDKNKIPYDNLFNYIIKQNEEKLEKIEKFLEKYNKIHSSEENLLFIFQNNLEDFEFKKDDLNEDIIFVEKLIIDYKLKSDYICSLDRKTFDILKESGNIISFILENKENWIKKFLKYKSEKEWLKEDKKYIHSSSLFFQKINDLIEQADIENFFEKYDTLYNDENFTATLNFNKKVLKTNPKDKIGLLNSFYELFEKIEDDIKKALIEEIFSQSWENISFIYEILISSKWILDNSSFNYTSLTWNIHKIIQQKSLFESVKSPQEIFDWIKLCIEDWENTQEKKDDKNSQIHKYFIELYWEKWDNFLKQKKLSPQEIEQLNHIWEIIKEIYKPILLQHIQENKQINLRWLYSLLSFFSNFWIIHFNNFEKIIDFTNENKIQENINHLYKNFSKYNIVNGGREEFKWVVLKYIKNNNQKIINDYLEKEKPQEIEIKNNYDAQLLEILKKWNEKEINELWQKIEKMINSLISLFNPRRTSSMKNNKTGRWSWTFTEIIDNYFIRRLKKEENESYLDYIERIYIFSWLNINNFYNKTDLDREKQLVVESIEKKSLWKQYLFQNLENLGWIIHNISNRQINLSELEKIYIGILNGELSSFKKDFWDFEQWEFYPQKKTRK